MKNVIQLVQKNDLILIKSLKNKKSNTFTFKFYTNNNAFYD